MTIFKSAIGSFTTVNGIRYTCRERSYPKTKTCWDGGAAGGVIYPCTEDKDPTRPNRFTHPDGYYVTVGQSGLGKSFATFLKAADYAQKKQRQIYDRHKAFVAAFDAQVSPPIDREAFDAFWSQNQHLGFKDAREQFRALVKEGVING